MGQGGCVCQMEGEAILVNDFSNFAMMLPQHLKILL